MSAIPITLFFSLLLAGTFVALFAREQRRRSFGSAERDSLLPLADEAAQVEGGAPVLAGRSLRTRLPGEHDHDDAGATCGCRRGRGPACPDCLRRRDAEDPAYF